MWVKACGVTNLPNGVVLLSAQQMGSESDELPRKHELGQTRPVVHAHTRVELDVVVYVPQHSTIGVSNTI